MEQEEVERIRQERLRECAVCMDEADIDQMVQLPCTHWYCIEDLDSKSSWSEDWLTKVLRVTRCLPRSDPSTQTLPML